MMLLKLGCRRNLTVRKPTCSETQLFANPTGIGLFEPDAVAFGLTNADGKDRRQKPTTKTDDKDRRQRPNAKAVFDSMTASASQERINKSNQTPQSKGTTHNINTTKFRKNVRSSKNSAAEVSLIFRLTVANEINRCQPSEPIQNFVCFTVLKFCRLRLVHDFS